MKESTMKIDAPRWIFPMLALLGLLSLPLYGCNTMEGAGEDIQDAGEAVEDAAD